MRPREAVRAAKFCDGTGTFLLTAFGGIAPRQIGITEVFMRSALLLVLLLLFTQFGYAQSRNLRVPTLSPITEIAQEVGLTEVKLSYSRPSAKGRDIFGELVPFGEVWRTGANASTKLTFSENVKIAGNDLKAGTYALYTIPGETEWTIIIHTNTKHRSLAGDVYKPAEDAFRFKATPRKTSNFVETFTIGFSDIATDSLQVAIAWENTEVKFAIDFDVDARIDEQIKALSASPEGMTPQSLFLAAEYNLHNGRDLAKAEEWISSALEKTPKDPRFGLLRAKILAKAGKTDEALKVIADANAWAKESNNENYTEQTQLFWDSIKP